MTLHTFVFVNEKCQHANGKYTTVKFPILFGLIVLKKQFFVCTDCGDIIRIPRKYLNF